LAADRSGAGAVTFFKTKVLASVARIDARLARIEEKLGILPKEEETTIMDITRISADVARETTVEQSAIALLGGLKKSLDDAIAANNDGDPTELLSLSQQIENNTDALAAAVKANTPAAAADPTQAAPAASGTSSSAESEQPQKTS